jgi:hypothetical protein
MLSFKVMLVDNKRFSQKMPKTLPYANAFWAFFAKSTAFVFYPPSKCFAANQINRLKLFNISPACHSGRIPACRRGGEQIPRPGNSPGLSQDS